MAAFLRGKVSKKKKRFQEDGFDLDLTYVTDRIIAMGYPSEGMEAGYRNPMGDVQRFFTQRHPSTYKIYNVCSERHYEAQKFEALENPGIACHKFVWDDHNPPPLKLIAPMVDDMVEYLAANSTNVVAIHCKAGKGRTGTIIACLLLKLQSGGIKTPNEALRKFAVERTHNAKGVTIPSQMRYVHYYSKILSENDQLRPEKMLRLKHVRLVTVPVFDSVALQGGGCDPYFHIKVRNTKGKMIKIYDFKKNNKVRHIKSKEKKADIDCTNATEIPPPLAGDIKMIFYDYDSYSSDDKMFHVWFNTGYVENKYLRFTKAVTDKACKDLKNKHFSDHFEIELFFETVTETEGGSLDYEAMVLDGSDEDHDTDEEEEALEAAQKEQAAEGESKGV